MEPEDRRVGNDDLFPLAAMRDPVTAPDALAEGPVRFLLVSGELDDGRWGLIGAFWLSIDGTRGGFVVAPRRSGMAPRWHGASGAHRRVVGTPKTSTGTGSARSVPRGCS